MKFEHESWRKLYIAESIEHRLLPLFTRTVRDYLLRFATEDGTLLKQTKNATTDLARVLLAEPGDAKQLAKAIEQLIEIEYLTLAKGRLYVTRFAEAQSAKSPGAVRQKRYRERNAVTPVRDGTGDVSSDVTNDVTSDETRRDETRRDPPTPIALTPEPDPAPQKLPLDFQLHPAAVADLVRFTGQTEAVIRAAADEFKGYWTIGGGMGRKFPHWQAKCRDDIRRKHETGRLLAIAKRLGAAEDADTPTKLATLADIDRLLGADQPDPGLS